MYTKEMLETLLDIIPECIFYRDIDGGHIYCNRSYAEDLIGLPKDEIYGKTYDELPALEKIHKIGTIKDLEVFEGKEHILYELSILNSKGIPQEVEVNKYPAFDEDGNMNGILGVIRDISYKKELDRLRDGFFSNVRHEFRTPLNMILSNIQLLEYKCSKCTISSSKTCKGCFVQNIKQIHNNSLRILKLVNNFIDITNMQVGTYQFKPRNYDIVSWVERICENINNYKTFNGISLIFDTDIEELIVKFDLSHIERVMLNLISNAIKFNKENGSILISITHDSNVVKISVKDTGVGIPEEHLYKVFMPFYNVEDRLTKISEGSGVGLSLSKSLIEMHRGTIKVKSQVGVGTEVIITIPNVCDGDEDKDINYLKIDENSLSRMQMELSDIYV